MKNKITVKCLNTGKYHHFHQGVNLATVASELNIDSETPILAAMVNNTPKSLDFELYHSKTINFIDINHPEGKRIYIRSLSFLLYTAIKKTMPDVNLRIEHSVSKGIYCELKEVNNISIETVTCIYEEMLTLIEEDLPFYRHEAETEKVIEIFKENKLYDKAKLLETRARCYSNYNTLDGVINYFYGHLAPSTGYLKLFGLHKYYNGMLLQVPKYKSPKELEDLVIQNKMFEVFSEHSERNEALNITNISNINKLVKTGYSKLLIQVSEAFHEKSIGAIADKIYDRKDDLKIVLISGPSSSGKTSFSKRLSVQLISNGLFPRNISLDDYFVDRERTPLDKNGEYDFEALEALDLDLFNTNIQKLLNGEEIANPTYSFESGKRIYKTGNTMKLNKNEILIIEGIHALNPDLTKLINNKYKYKIYVSALSSINIDDHNRIQTTDNRLVRRIVRDYKYRNYSALDTISRWQSVRKGEEKHIFPYQEEADVMFNSALVYELLALKKYAEPILLELQSNHCEYAEAIRLLKFFKLFENIDEKTVPPTSIVREFIGGSSFDY